MNKKCFVMAFGAFLLSFSNLPAQERETTFIAVGEKIDLENVLTVFQMSQQYEKMISGDTLNLKFSADVLTVCKNKGCWMTLDMGSGQEVMVKFKDYGIFVPKDIEQKEVVVNGRAYVTEFSVEDQRHYAEDEGKSAEEINAITTAKKTWSFMADGVLIRK